VFVHHLISAGDEGAAEAEAALRQSVGRGRFRTPEQVGTFFEGLDQVDPGVVSVT
jgi:hypothetical protein